MDYYDPVAVHVIMFINMWAKFISKSDNKNYMLKILARTYTAEILVGSMMIV